MARLEDRLGFYVDVYQGDTPENVTTTCHGVPYWRGHTSFYGMELDTEERLHPIDVRKDEVLIYMHPGDHLANNKMAPRKLGTYLVIRRIDASKGDITPEEIQSIIDNSSGGIEMWQDIRSTGIKWVRNEGRGGFVIETGSGKTYELAGAEFHRYHFRKELGLDITTYPCCKWVRF